MIVMIVVMLDAVPVERHGLFDFSGGVVLNYQSVRKSHRHYHREEEGQQRQYAMASIIWNLLLSTRTSIVITNPNLVKYLIFQLFAEAILLCTLFILSAILLTEEWYYRCKVWERQRVQRQNKLILES
jgi:hypothetical protein